MLLDVCCCCWMVSCCPGLVDALLLVAAVGGFVLFSVFVVGDVLLMCC